MIINSEVQDVSINGAMETKQFTIKASAKAFEILSKNLYSNAIGAVVRELSTNAYDAHIMANKADVPFDIKIPNALDPVFKIRDYGPGLSHEQIENIYTTFFESTKTDSNDVVGCLGLGSKSPFAITDSFTVNSYYNGTKTVYSAYLDSSRTPNIAKFAEMPTDEENGLEIEIAVKKENEHTFNSEINHQLRFFKVKPNISGSSFEWYDEEKTILEGDTWKLLTNGNYRHNAGPKALQGQIAYPIDTTSMGNIYDETSDAVKAILNKNFIIEFPIGTVNIAPSREALSYDEDTSRNIIAAAQKVFNELLEQIQKMIQSAENEFDAKLSYYNISEELFGWSSYSGAFKEEISKEITWNDIPINDGQYSFEANKISSWKKYNYNYNGRWASSTKYTHSLVYGKDDEKWHVGIGELVTKNDELMPVFVAVDTDKSVLPRCKQYASNNGIKTFHVIQVRIPFDEFKQLLDGANIIEVSGLDKVTYNRNKTQSGKFKIQEFYRWGNSKATIWTNEEVSSIPTDENSFIVNLDTYDIMYDGNVVTYDSFKDIIAFAKDAKIIDSDTTIYGIRKANRKKITTQVNIFDHIKDNLDKISQKVYKFDNEEISVRFINRLNDSYYIDGVVAPLLEQLEQAKVDERLIDLLKKIKHNIEQRNASSSIVNSFKRIEYSFNKLFGSSKDSAISFIVDETPLAKELNEKYNMLNHMDVNYMGVDKLVEVIKDLELLYNIKQEVK